MATVKVDYQAKREALKQAYLKPKSKRAATSARGLHHLALICSDIERTIERIESMPWPERAKEMMSQVLRTGRMPSPILEREAAASADPESAAAEEPSTDGDLELPAL